jgi:hypothetical protein
MTAENATIRLVVDGEVIWDDTYTVQNAIFFIGQTNSSVGGGSRYICETSLELQVQMTTDTSINLQYNAHPIA